jgi:hypothetical protein
MPTIPASDVIFSPAGSGAVSRTVQNKLLDVVNVRDFGVTGDGTTDDAPAIRACLAANIGRAIYFPGTAASYRCASSLGVIPNYTSLIGENRWASRIRKDFNGVLATLADGVTLRELWFDGNGANRTGKGLTVEGSDGNQNVADCRIVDFEDTPLYFEATAGSRSRWDNVEAWRTGGTSGSGKYAVVIQDVLSGGTPRSFSNLQTGGNQSIDFGGGNNVFVVNSALFDLKFSDNSRNVTLATSRIASTQDVELKGSGSIIGCDFGSTVIVKSGAAFNLGPNLYNNGWEDQSGSSGNLIFAPDVIPFTPVVKAGTTPITVGNGDLSASYVRHGKIVRVEYRLLVGSTTSIAFGQPLTFSTPFPAVSFDVQTLVAGRMFDSNGAFYRIGGYLVSGDQTVHLERDGSGALAAGQPGPLGAGALLQFSVDYLV